MTSLSTSDTGQAANDRSQRESLARLLNARSVAFVGVSESSMFASAAQRTLAGGVDVSFVHPKHKEAFGHPCHASLEELEKPVDAVFSATSAKPTVEIVRQAAQVGAAGVVTFAGGFADTGAEGAALQNEMAAIAHANGLSVIGPNGIGMLNVPQNLNLAMLTEFERRPGGLSAVSHSGAMLGALSAAAWRPGGAGLNLLISAGNEAVTDMADYLDYLVEDENTRVIVLALEKIRRPGKFFEAAARALEAEKPIIAVKMARGARGARMAASHTGTLTGDAWVYDIAFQQAGIQLARDLDDVVDRVQLLEQLPRQKWTEVRGLSVLTMMGGFAQLASDLGDGMEIDIPELPELQPWVAENIPGSPVPNPLDATGFVGSMPGLWDDILKMYTGNEHVDALVFLSQHADWDERMAANTAQQFADTASTTDKPMIIGPAAGRPGQWLERLREQGLAVSNGLMGCLRGLETMAGFMRTRPSKRVASSSTTAEIAMPSVKQITVAEGQMLPFDATMTLLQDSGIAVAPYTLVGEGESVTSPPFDGPYVVKLADVAHRTEHSAVDVGVTADELSNAVERMRGLAARHGLPPAVAIQPMVSGHGEAFIGIQGASELGPLVVFGLGGIFVELLKKVGGRLAPFSAEDAVDLIDEFSSTGVLDGFRGSKPWDRNALTDLLIRAGSLAAGGRNWIDSIDINPLIITDEGPIAVDALCLVQQ